MDRKFLALTAELARLEKRKREIVSELERGGFSSDERRLWRSILGQEPSDEQLIEYPGPPFRGVPARRNMLAGIRDLLASDPEREFTAAEIGNQLGIDRSQEKSFYAALAKLNGAGQIRRVSKGLYRTVMRKPKSK